MASSNFAIIIQMDIVQLRLTMQEECQLAHGAPVLAGISGGPDSLCLLDILCRLEYPVIVAHFDHGLRPDSAADAQNVQRHADKLGLECIIGSRDVAAYANSERLSIEEAARKARYRFLFDQARSKDAQAVAVAHNADDQVETVLMHLLRGSGLNGLKGMPYRCILPDWDSAIPLVRPLLGVWRTEILAYCQERGLQPLFDPTNQDTIYFRNRLRHELIPYLEGYNPRVRQVVWRMARTLAADSETLELQIEQAWSACMVRKGDDFVSLSLPRLKTLNKSLLRSVLRRAIAVLRPHLRDIDFHSIERAIDFLHTPTSTRQVDLVDNLRLAVDGEQIFIAEWSALLQEPSWPQLAPGAVLDLPLPGSVMIGNGWTLHAEAGDLDEVVERVFHNPDPFQIWLDADALANPLVIRARRPGERFRPLGMQEHSQKLSDFLVNAHLPARARPAWPLVVCGDEVAWIPGYQPGHAFRVKEGTKKVVFLKLERVES